MKVLLRIDGGRPAGTKADSPDAQAVRRGDGGAGDDRDPTGVGRLLQGTQSGKGPTLGRGWQGRQILVPPWGKQKVGTEPFAGRAPAMRISP